MLQPLAIANYFVQKSLEEDIELTTMKLLKLVYISHGWHLGEKGEPLISEPIEAWRYGPVIPSLYREFKFFGNSQITNLGYGFTSDFSIYIPLPNKDESKFLDGIWEKYKNKTGMELSTYTHEPNTPWDIVWNKQNGRDKKSAQIGDNLIKYHYQNHVVNNINPELL